MSSLDEDKEKKVALMIVGGVVAVVVASVLWFSGWGFVTGKVDALNGAASGAAASAASAPAADAASQEAASAPAAASGEQAASAASNTGAADEAKVVVDGGVVKFYFASGKSDLAAGANDALADVVKGVATGKKAVVSGFHDSTGNAEVNAQVSKERAMKVKEALIALGVAEDQIELKKPEQTQGGADAAEARRVEVVLQ